MNWTNEQSDAINAPMGKGSILVGAAAGSGKTAVLVERIIRNILSRKTEIDRLLVVTFTNAAAAQMRAKIVKQFYELLDDKNFADRDFVKRQISLVPEADITTIDSFCMKTLKNNFYVLGTDPNFRIADSTEAELISDEAMNTLFESLYESDEQSEDYKSFEHLLNIYADNRSDEKLKTLVRSIYNFSQSFADPGAWLDNAEAYYSADMSESEWVKRIIPEIYIREIGIKYYGGFERIIRKMANLGGDKPIDAQIATELAEEYGEMANGLITLLKSAEALQKAKSWQEAHEIYGALLNSGMDTLTLRNRPKGIGADIEEWKYYLKLRNDLKKKFLNECEVFSYAEAELGSLMHGDALLKQVRELAWIVRLYGAEFIRQKELRNVKEFNDIEHSVYRLFFENADIRRSYIEKYDEILIDEYQDTNGLQDGIFTSISRDAKNIFMVGDLKQSIYRFRGGDPTIFKMKSRDFGSETNEDIKINLYENFRSRQEILHSVNSVFEKTMSNATGDVDYGEKERIVRRADMHVRDDNFKSEAYFVTYEDNGGDEEMSATEAEAQFIAEKINDMKGKMLMSDGRAMKYSDVTILMRSVRNGAADCILSALEKYNINACVEIEDYFTKREVRIILDLISVIDNNLQDIPLAAVMRSPIGNFSENDMAKIRISSPNGYLYHAVKNYGNAAECENGLKIRCDRLIEELAQWREYVKKKSVARLIWDIYEETGFYDFMGAFEVGEEAQANLRLLYDRAKDYEGSGFKGLFNFLRYIERIEEGSGDLSGANLTGEEHDVVRIMTMHKSKGLEFPVVFLAGMGRKMNFRQSLQNVVLHKDYGIGLKYADAEAEFFEDTLCYRALCNLNAGEELSEAMRLLYVGMTRPKEKLITVTSKKIKPSKKMTYEECVSAEIEKWQEGILPSEAKCYADWIYPVAVRDKEHWEFFHVDVVLSEDKVQEEENVCELKISDELRNVVNRYFEYRYKYERSGEIPSKTSVTALKQMQKQNVYDADRKYECDPIYMDEVPEFMRDKKRGTEIGTAHHQVMAYIDLEKIKNTGEDEYEEFVRSEMTRIVQMGQLDKYYCEDKDICSQICEHISGFFRSDLGRKMLNADKVYRERPFEIMIGANEYDSSLEDFYKDEGVILQGVIDCFFEKDGRLTLLDYKTDKVLGEDGTEKLKEKYRIQLELYSRAIEKILGKKTHEKYLYLFDKNCEEIV